MHMPEKMARWLSKRGISTRQLKALLIVYLKQDLRGGKSLVSTHKGDYIKSNWSLLLIAVLYTIFGLTVAVTALTEADVFAYSMLALSFTFFIALLGILAESGNVIFDETEADVIGHLPISSRTYFTAKVLNLFLFTLLIALSASFFPAVFGIWAVRSNLLFAVAHAVSATLMALLATALVVISYGLLMRFVSRERFDNIIAYSQGALALFFMLGYQIVPRIAGSHEILTSSAARWYHFLYPPAWFSGLTMLMIGRGSLKALALASLALASLAILGTLAFRKIAGGYSSFLSKLSHGTTKARAGSEQGKGRGAKRAKARNDRVLEGIKAAFLRRPAERAVFDLVSLYLRRDREIKVRLYPSLTYAVVFPILALISEGLPNPFLSAQVSFYGLLGAAMVCFSGLSAVEVLVFSAHYRASYIFHVTPIARRGDIHGGIRKAIFVNIALPSFLALLLLFGFIWRNPFHALLVLAPWIIIMPAVLLVPFTFREVLPLSRKYQKGQQSARNLSIFLSSFAGLSVITGLQIASLKGYRPYWSFVLIIAVAAPLIHSILTRINGEAGPLKPQDGSEEGG
ncbi:MAG TPA: hypothetical protein VNH22_13325 [Blastocatellia bacterium]|nr:hypothetical protein [Blastocatellia bacterium]